MPKNRKSNREAKKKPALTMKEKRAVRKAKDGASPFIINERTSRRPTL